MIITVDHYYNNTELCEMENSLQNSLYNIILGLFLYAIESMYKKINLGGWAQNVINVDYCWDMDNLYFYLSLQSNISTVIVYGFIIKNSQFYWVIYHPHCYHKGDLYRRWRFTRMKETALVCQHSFSWVLLGHTIGPLVNYTDSSDLL